jgi:simple sugar transport system ATP-binding protein
VLRGGKLSGTADPRVETNESLATLMIGSELSVCQLTPREPGGIMLELTNLNLATRDPFGTTLKQIDLRVRAGEIVGIAGVSGNGQKELMAALSGETSLSYDDRGAIRIDGQLAGQLNPAERRKLGVTFVPEERLGRGAVPPMSLSNNALLTGATQGMVRFGLVRNAAARSFADRAIAGFKVKCGGHGSAANSLSGGNLQKFIVGRETLLAPRIMIAAQPTWGVDVGASQMIRQALIDLRDQGVAVLVVSEELDELFAICDRIAVIAQGHLSPTRKPAETSIEEIGYWMAGGFITDGAEREEALHAAA